MEVINNKDVQLPEILQSTQKPFIQANTFETSLHEIKNGHVIPVFIKDNEPVISHSDFIEATFEVVSSIFPSETVLYPSIRVSHPIKGRIPEAKHKPADQLLESEKTLYYERMAFIIEIPTIYDEVGENTLSLTVGGIKAYNLDNLYSKKGADEHFKIFIGFRNQVCTNLCVWSDGFQGDVRVKSMGQLKLAMHALFTSYNAANQIDVFKQLRKYILNEQQFAHLIGRCRMFHYLPVAEKEMLTPLYLSDTQLGAVVKDFYKDKSFSRDRSGNINLWKLYNLFTGSNKSSYIDTFLDRSVNASDFVLDLKKILDRKETSWFLN